MDHTNEVITTKERRLRCYEMMGQLVGQERSTSAASTTDITTTSHCPVTWDGVMCWPRSLPGSTTQLACFKEFNGVLYVGNATAVRMCTSAGSWKLTADYSGCVVATADANSSSNWRQHHQLLVASEGPSIIYLIGYTVSLASLFLALLIFCACRDLWCMRNFIHANLFTTYLLTSLVWITSYSIQVLWVDPPSIIVCAIMLVLHFCHSSTFFWMFVEGHFLYCLVARTFRSNTELRHRAYLIIGWGCPFLVVGMWAVLKTEWLSRLADVLFSIEADKLNNKSETHCPWLRSGVVDWVYIAPSIFVLAINVVFLVRIMWILVTKLRSSVSYETNQSKKAAKALLVLLPMLGGTYVLIITRPTDGLWASVFAYVQAALISTQGLTVALVHCFFNEEIRKSLCQHYRRWTDVRQTQRTASRMTSRRTVTIELRSINAERDVYA